MEFQGAYGNPVLEITGRCRLHDVALEDEESLPENDLPIETIYQEDKAAPRRGAVGLYLCFSCSGIDREYDDSSPEANGAWQQRFAECVASWEYKLVVRDPSVTVSTLPV